MPKLHFLEDLGRKAPNFRSHFQFVAHWFLKALFMTPYCLTEVEYKSKKPSKMFEVTDSAEAILDIWPYVLTLTQRNIISKNVYANFSVEYVFRDSQKKYDHVLLLAKDVNTYIALVIDIKKENIDGYYVLYSIKEYGLT